MTSDDFIEKGFEYYGETAGLMWAFEREILKRLWTIISGRLESAGFRKTQDREEVSGTPGDGWWVAVVKHGSAAGKGASVEIGYWWNPPTVARTPVVYTVLYGVVPALQIPVDVETFSYKGGTVLASPMPLDMDARVPISAQLDLVVQALRCEPR